ncbi:MAG: hypothetical protein HZA54_02720 [Planctomycetes bacterium]|nr:hypothetical protein [Planctomycetota bacterium]
MKTQAGYAGKPYNQKSTPIEWVAPVLRRSFADTAFWVAQARTDASGKAVVTVTLPDNLTTWRATARCITQDTLVGSATARVIARKNVLLRLDAPRYLTQNDSIELAAYAHNNLPGAQDVKTEITAVGLLPGEGPGAAAPAGSGEILILGPEIAGLEPGGMSRHAGRVLAAVAGKARVQGKAQTVDESDALELEIPVLPHGLAVVAGYRGEVADRARVEFALPAAGVVPGTEKVEIRVTPSLALSLLDSIQYLQDYPYGCIEQTLNRFAPAIAARAAMRKLGLPHPELAERLDRLVAAGLLRVFQLQNPDGGWGWWNGDDSHAYTTAYVLECLAECMAAGYPVNEPLRAKALGYVVSQLLPNTGADLNAKAALLYGLACHGVAADEEALRVYRQRDTLDAYALALAARAFARINKSPYAAQAVELLRAAAVSDGAFSYWKAREGNSWIDNTVETTAQAVRTLIALDPANAHIARAIAWLEAQKRGDRWGSTKETAAVLRALADYLALAGNAGQDYSVAAFLNDKPIRSWQVAKGRIPTADAYLVLGPADLAKGANVVRFEKNGIGNFTYSVTASYFKAAEDIEAEGQRVAVARRYRDLATVQAQEKDEGALTGYTILKPEKRPADTAPSLERTPLGSKFQVELKLTSTEELEYAMLEDPIPAGCEPVELSVAGAITKSERHDNRMVFFFTRLPKGETTVTYLADAVAAGRYHALPARASLMYRPEVWGHSAENRLAVQDRVELEAAGGKGHAPLPDELYLAGKAACGKQEYGAARAALVQLPLADLQDNYRIDVLGMLLDAALALGPAAELTKAYENLIDLDPRRGFGAADLTTIARAYQSGGEAEQTHFLLSRALGQYLDRDLRGVQALRDLNRLPLAYDRLEKVLRDYPDTFGAVIGQAFNLANEYLSLKPLVDPQKSELEQKQAERAQVLAGIRALRQFIVTYPDQGVCDRAQIAVAQALGRLGLMEELASAAGALIRRYPQSDFVDDAQYALAAAQAQLGRYDDARAAAERLIATKYKNERGEMAASPYNDPALYLLGKIAHVMGDLEKAVGYYQRSSFGDSKAALAFLTAKELALGGTVTVPFTPAAGSAAAPPIVVPVKFKNLKAATFKLYKVDLLVLLAAKKDLGNLAGVELTGITPLAEWNVAFGAAQAFTWGEQPVEIPLPEAGAYLVVARTDEGVGASTVVLRTDLALKVQQIENRVRVYAYGGPAARPAKGAYVKISDGSTLIAEGYTDERGIFEGGAGRALPKLSVSADWNGNPGLFVQ